MKSDEFEDEYLYAEASNSEDSDEEDPLENDEISAEEDGFLRGYEEANKEAESDEEED